MPAVDGSSKKDTTTAATSARLTAPLGTDSAIEVLRKSRARGFKGVIISCWPSGGDQLTDDDDPFWAAAADEGMPVCIHVNLISRRTRQKQRAAAAKASAATGTKGERGIYGGLRQIDGDEVVCRVQVILP